MEYYGDNLILQYGADTINRARAVHCFIANRNDIAVDKLRLPRTAGNQW